MSNQNEQISKIEKQAAAFVAMGLVVKTDNGYTVSTPAMRGCSRFYLVAGGTCECLHFEDTGDCAHVRAAEIAEQKMREVKYFETEAPIASADNFRLAAQQALNLKMSEDAALAPCWLRAFEKAEKEIAENETVEFNNNILTMRSRGTGILYTASSEACECKAFQAEKPCYHRAIQAILANYFSGEVVTFSEADRCFWCLNENIVSERGELVCCAFCGRQPDTEPRRRECQLAA